MNTSQKTPFLSEILSGESIPLGKLAFFRERFRDQLYDLVLAEFLKQEAKGLTKREIARRIGRRPEQVTRWLGAPGNWTVETVSDLLLAICQAEPTVNLRRLGADGPRNYQDQDWHPDNYAWADKSSKSLAEEPRPKPPLGEDASIERPALSRPRSDVERLFEKTP